MQNEVVHDQKDHKFYRIIDGEEAHLTYHMTDENVINFNHTYVPPAHRGQGYAAELVKYGLDFARQKNYSVIPSCSYVASFIRRYDEYEDLVNSK